MGMIYYLVCMLLAFLFLLIYVYLWHKHCDINITIIFVLIPIVNVGYVLRAASRSLEAALLANKIVYIGGAFLLSIIMFAVFDLCDIQLKRWFRTFWLSFNVLVYLAALTMGNYPLFYRSAEFEIVNGVANLRKTYGPIHAVFIGMVLFAFAQAVLAILYSYAKKNQVSRKNLVLLYIPAVAAVISFFFLKEIVPGIEPQAAVFVFALLNYLIIVYRICLYDVSETAADSLVEAGRTGFITVDFKENYLGSNQTAKEIFPDLLKLTVDRPISRSQEMKNTVQKWLKDFIENESNDQTVYEKNDRFYQIHAGYLYDDHRKRGYQLTIEDDTENQNYIRLINSYNTQLNEEVKDKTKHIVEMHDNLILSMAMMVESRDNSTGGHIRRTSEGVRILIEEMRNDPECTLTDSFCRAIIKAAPMHDLGKVAVDDRILRKPGRFTPEEFNEMKRHAAEGARIVHEILKGTDDEEFKVIAENVAHYHHERWDGSGYPEGLKEKQIPLEARIMAIADVYDALVSKRVYKDSMSFEEADRIITEGMGSQFDPSLEPYYRSARPKLEAYYRTVENL